MLSPSRVNDFLSRGSRVYRVGSREFRIKNKKSMVRFISGGASAISYCIYGNRNV